MFYLISRHLRHVQGPDLSVWGLWQPTGAATWLSTEVKVVFTVSQEYYWYLRKMGENWKTFELFDEIDRNSSLS